MEYTLTEKSRDTLIPMHLEVGSTGHILRAGPTLRKVFGTSELDNRRFLEVFEVVRPARIHSFNDLQEQAGRRLLLKMRDAPEQQFTALAVPTNGGERLVVNLSFGISIVDAVRRFELTIEDFAATELTVEMLYLVEAKAAVLDELRKLNTSLQGAKTAAEMDAATDMLTGLKNRRALDHVLDQWLAAEVKFSLMQIDLDYFKTVNDTLGHAAGDVVLKEVGRILTDATRDGDVVARVGGDEFVLLLRGLTDAEPLHGIATRIIEKLEVPVPFEGTECRISGSAGTAISSSYPHPTAEKLLHDADMALYASKDKGKACHTLFDEMDDAARQRAG